MIQRPVGDLTLDSLTNRFCYWQSSAGTRYIFSQISADDLATFKDCVLLLATEKDGQPTVQWIGDIADLSPRALQNADLEDLSTLGIYVHLLAGGDEQRQKVIADLSADAGKSQFRLSA
ncbi:hypothetical protein [uncultured Cohaesibacter sp.]|uniref:hypothetical protein n=1 Tax=uncultured Cohaesibacter sp. TaxID=1002546 RepID=UPI0029C772B4|nr:hypothetical protein [uncultured Cohaesibacter sp.]